MKKKGQSSTTASTTATGTSTAAHPSSSPFSVSLDELVQLIHPSKNLSLLRSLEGVEGLARRLHVDPKHGIVAPIGAAPTPEPHTAAASAPAEGSQTHLVSDPVITQSAQNLHATHIHLDGIDRAQTDAETLIEKRREVFGINRLPEEKCKSFLEIVWIAMHDKMLLVLIGAAVIQLAAGLILEFAFKSKEKNKWIEGVAIMVVVCIVVMVGSVNDWKKERLFRSLQRQKEARNVAVLRNQKKAIISIFDLVVGDVLLLQPGDILSTDGILIETNGLECDESSATGESDAIKKSHDKDPFLLSGSKVIEGTGSCLVTGVGEHSSYGKIMMSLRTELQPTPLQEKLNNLAEIIAKLGGAFAVFMFVALIIRYLIQTLGGFYSGPAKVTGDYVEDVLSLILTSIAIVVVAVPEGLPLAVTLALSIAAQRMLKDNNLVRVLASCEVMANATTICSDKTGTLTQNKMTVVKARCGLTVDLNTPTQLAQLRSALDPTLFETLQEGIAVNSSAFEEVDDNNVPYFVGSKTETALLEMQRKAGISFSAYRTRCPLLHSYPFSSATKWMGSVHAPKPGVMRMHVKGASEVILARCTQVLDGKEARALTSAERASLEACIESFAKQSLRTIALAYRDFPETSKWPAHFTQEAPLSELVFLAVVGIEDPLREGVVEAVASCQQAGVFVRMVTGDNVTTARAIATQAGIFQPGGIVLEGPQFRKLSEAELEKTLPRLQVLARSSPLDKQKLVGKLKDMGEVVAVTGDGTNDAPALKLSDVGFSMGIAGTEVAKEASSIVLIDDNFSSIVRALLWGRSVNDSVRKFLQFQLAVNVSAVVTTFVTSLIPMGGEEGGILTVVQLLWVNMIMDSLAALAYATEPPQPDVLLNRHPDSKASPLIHLSMWKMVIGEALLQIVVLLTCNYAIPDSFFVSYNRIPLVAREEDGSFEHRTLLVRKTFLFNAFIFFQLMNQINCRSLTSDWQPVFKGILSNRYFMVILILIMVVQVILVEFGGQHAFKTMPMSAELWCISVAVGFASLPFGFFLRACVPNEWLTRIPVLRRLLQQEKTFMTKERLQWHNAIHKVQTQLAVFRALRGDRVLASYHSMHSSTIHSAHSATSVQPSYGHGQPTSREAIAGSSSGLLG